MDTLPLPPHPDLAQYRKRAKDLVTAANARNDDAVRAWAKKWLESLARLLKVEITPPYRAALERAIDVLETRVREATTNGSEFSLASAQFVIATAHGFENWSTFVTHLDQASSEYRGTAAGRTFEAAVDAVVTGDLASLQSLVREHPKLVRAHSARVHRATLLHYVAANGVEDFRQRTPANAVDVARFLLEAGSEVDAIASTYSGDAFQTTMNLLVSSAHPAEAGLQSALVEVLLDFGAAINGLKDDESPILTALDFGYGKTAETLARRGARVDNVVVAAALGRLDLVEHFVIDRDKLQPNVPFVAPPWRDLPNEPKIHIELAFVWACKFARTDVAHFLLAKGVDPGARDGYKMTALHWAAANGCLALVNELLERGAPLEVQNVWGGTVLDSTLHFVAYMPVEDANYLPVINRLIAAGANTDVIASYPAGNPIIDELRRSFPSAE